MRSSASATCLAYWADFVPIASARDGSGSAREPGKLGGESAERAADVLDERVYRCLRSIRLLPDDCPHGHGLDAVEGIERAGACLHAGSSVSAMPAGRLGVGAGAPQQTAAAMPAAKQVAGATRTLASGRS